MYLQIPLMDITHLKIYLEYLIDTLQVPSGGPARPGCAADSCYHKILVRTVWWSRCPAGRSQIFNQPGRAHWLPPTTMPCHESKWLSMIPHPAKRSVFGHLGAADALPGGVRFSISLEEPTGCPLKYHAPTWNDLTVSEERKTMLPAGVPHLRTLTIILYPSTKPSLVIIILILNLTKFQLQVNGHCEPTHIHIT